MKEQDVITCELRQKIQVLLSSVNCLSVTVDIWSRCGLLGAFIGITAHFYCQKDDKIRNLLIACREIQQPHTANMIDQIYQNIMDKFGIAESKVFHIITDNGANVVKAFRYTFSSIIIN